MKIEILLFLLFNKLGFGFCLLVFAGLAQAHSSYLLFMKRITFFISVYHTAYYKKKIFL